MKVKFGILIVFILVSAVFPLRAFAQSWSFPLNLYGNGIVNEIRPNPINRGDEFEIIGRGFGDYPGIISITNSKSGNRMYDYSIISWSDESIRVRLGLTAGLFGINNENNNLWDIAIMNPPSSAVIESPILLILGDNLQSQLSPQFVYLTLHAFAVCGKDKQPVPGAGIEFYKDTIDPNNLFYSAKTNYDGEAKIELSIYEADYYYTYLLSAVPIAGLPGAKPQKYLINIDNSTKDDYRYYGYLFEYPYCGPIFDEDADPDYYRNFYSDLNPDIDSAVGNPEEVPEEKPVDELEYSLDLEEF